MSSFAVAMEIHQVTEDALSLDTQRDDVGYIKIVLAERTKHNHCPLPEIIPATNCSSNSNVHQGIISLCSKRADLGILLERLQDSK